MYLEPYSQLSHTASTLLAQVRYKFFSQRFYLNAQCFKQTAALALSSPDLARPGYNSQLLPLKIVKNRIFMRKTTQIYLQSIGQEKEPARAEARALDRHARR
jgi:hypothetical protein